MGFDFVTLGADSGFMMQAAAADLAQARTAAEAAGRPAASP